MATLRLFAGLRETAGTSEIAIDAATVGEVIDRAVADYGDHFAEQLATSRVWVNGEPADTGTKVDANDEVAIIPPVSGGTVPPETSSTVAARATADPAENILSFILLSALFIAAWIPVEWFVVVAVGAALAWLWDLAATDARNLGYLNIYVLVAAPPIAGMATYAWGIEGWAGAVGAAILIAITWPIFDKNQRDVPAIGANVTVAVIAATGTGAFVLLRMISTMTVLAFMFVVAAGILGAVATSVYGGQSLDPNVGALVASIVAGVLVGLLASEFDIATGLFSSVAAAVGLIAGRAFGSLMRAGTIVHTVRAPGHLSPIDGVLVAAPLFWMALIILN
jgi:MoaD family protein